MAHELDITNGVASFVTARKPAWHRLGTVFDRPMTAVEAMEAAHLARWDVRTVPMTSTEITPDGVTTHDEPNYVQVRRTNPVTGASERLGVVGKRFTHIQNEETVAFLEALLAESGAQFIETAGALRGGAQVFYTARLPGGMNIGGVDRHDLYMAAMNGHDGSMALRVIATPVRIVCANTQFAAIRGAVQEWSTRHTSGATQAVSDARRALDMTFKFNAAFEAAAERMMNTPVDMAEFETLVADLFTRTNKEQGKRAERSRIERFAVIRGLMGTETVGQFDGTRWGAYNGLTEYVDHHIDANGDTPEAKASGRALGAVTGAAQKVKSRAFAALSV